MGFCHGMMDGDEVLIFYRLDLDLMMFIRRFSLQSRKRYTAAADDRIPQGVDHVAADGADVQLGAEQIGGSVLIDDSIAFHEFHDGDTQGGGNQVSYRCDATQVTTIDFDRNKIRGMATALSKRADEISMSLDKCLVNTEVSYEPPFDMNDSFEDILSDFIEKSTAA